MSTGSDKIYKSISHSDWSIGEVIYCLLHVTYIHDKYAVILHTITLTLNTLTLLNLLCTHA
jgi:hypothetical protein